MMEYKFSFANKYKILFLIMMIIGVASGTLALINHGSTSYFWSFVLLNNYYFLAISLAGVFFIVVHVLGEAGWHTSIQRVPEAMGTFIPYAGILMLIMLIFGGHSLYEWIQNEHADPLIDDKKWYLNVPFFSARFVVYFAGWILLSYLMRKMSLMQDMDPDLRYYRRYRIFSGIFIVFFAITVSASSWDWLMSIDAHWFSTMYGWYIFSGLLVSGVAVIILIVLALKSAGYMQHLNKEHLHDLGKYLFAFSILWTYLWFSQYLLIWYGNLPEETVYFAGRLHNFKILFFLNLVMNFVAPFLILMTRNSKRTQWILAIAALMVFAGHWLDYYMAIMPGIMGKPTGFGFFEAGLTVGYLGFFLFITFRSLSKASLVPFNHPFFKESLEYHTNY